MAKRAILFINGDLAALPCLAGRRARLCLKTSDFLIGVDGGTRLILRLKRRPDLIVGDFDSFPNPPAPSLLKPDQDHTDTEFALDYCIKHGYKDIILVGILGTRLDHLIANIFLASRLNLTIIEGQQTLYFVPTKRLFVGRPGDLVSLIPLSDCAGVTTSGLKWRLRRDSLPVGSGRGISNVMTGKSARVSLKKGRLLVVYNRI